jgi:hypothetical protein
MYTSHRDVQNKGNNVYWFWESDEKRKYTVWVKCRVFLSVKSLLVHTVTDCTDMKCTGAYSDWLHRYEVYWCVQWLTAPIWSVLVHTVTDCTDMKCAGAYSDWLHRYEVYWCIQWLTAPIWSADSWVMATQTLSSAGRKYHCQHLRFAS